VTDCGAGSQSWATTTTAQCYTRGSAVYISASRASWQTSHAAGSTWNENYCASRVGLAKK